MSEIAIRDTKEFRHSVLGLDMKGKVMGGYNEELWIEYQTQMTGKNKRLMLKLNREQLAEVRKLLSAMSEAMKEARK